jgi:hypothetical protein
MPFNISNFNAEVSRTGIASPSFFEGVITAGPGSYNPNSGINSILREFGITRGLSFRIESLNMPGRILQTFDQNYHGPVRAIPFRFSVMPVTISVILSKDMRERQFFLKWQDYFVGHHRTNVNRSAIPGMFDTKYYDDAIGTMEIWQYSHPIGDVNTNQTRQRKENSETQKEPGVTRSQSQPDYILQTQILLEEAYPVSVNDIQMSWGDEGYGRLQVEMRYRYFIERHNFNSAGGRNSGEFERERIGRAITDIQQNSAAYDL